MVVNNKMERMRMEAAVSTFEAVFRHLLAKMRDYEKPQPANMGYLPPPQWGGGTEERERDMKFYSIRRTSGRSLGTF